jgi:proteasome beta subunit
MTLPIFSASDDPGPSFAELLRRTRPVDALPATAGPLEVTHGTTVVAVRYADGVVMAGDRRATSGHLIAGAAGPAMEMVKLFQLQLEHYEKVEGQVLSLEGKANQLGAMVRNHLPAAMQGMAVVPLFAGFDLRRGVGRLFQYDVTGGRYEEQDHTATGSGSLHAGTVVKLGFREGLGEDEVVDLALHALWQAADSDSATGGPDLIRGIFPVVATITAAGFTRLPDPDVRQRFQGLIDTMAAQQVGGTEPS